MIPLVYFNFSLAFCSSWDQSQRLEHILPPTLYSLPKTSSDFDCFLVKCKNFTSIMLHSLFLSILLILCILYVTAI